MFWRSQRRLVFLISNFLVKLPQLELFKDLGCREDARVDNAGHGERAADDGTDGGQEVINRRPLLMVSYCNWVQIVPAMTIIVLGIVLLFICKTNGDLLEPQSGDDPASVAE